MKTPFITLLKTPGLLFAVILLGLAPRVQAQLTTNLYSYTGNQTASPGTNWSGPGTTAYWKLNGAGATVAPSAGTSTVTSTNLHIFLLASNGIALGNGTATALIRDPYTSPFPNIATFPGDSLILGTNTQVRFKHGGNAGTLVTGVPFNIPTNNFPGNFGQPGLVLDGGCLNAGDSGYAYVIMGSLYVTPGVVSYLNPADSLAGDGVQRAIVINSQITGSGTVALLNGTNNVPQPVQGQSNYFTGTWVVRAGWLRGLDDGTGDGYNSLGTNGSCQYIINPLWPVPNTFASGSIFFNGPAILDMGSALANCAGSLVLTNGGQMYLHGNVIFSNVTVENFTLPNGTYTYAALAAMFSSTNGYLNNFSPAGFPAGSGTLTVQTPGSALFPPAVVTQPTPEFLYPGRTAEFTATGNGTGPLHYLWLDNGVPLHDGATGTGSIVAGSTTTSLSITNISAADATAYSLQITNLFGSITSSVAALTIQIPTEPFEIAVSNLNPTAFYQFNETTNPATGTAEAYDYAGGFNGTYGTNAQNGFNSIAGPNPTTGFPGFASGNLAANFTYNIAGSKVSVPAWNLNTNTVTLCAWINPSAAPEASAGVVYCRGADTVAGLAFLGAANPETGTIDLGYNWNNDPAAYGWDSGLSVPAGSWSFVSLVVTPASATIYVMNSSGLTSATHVYPHVSQAFGSADTTLIGDDSLDGGNGSRGFPGAVDDVAVFNSALSGAQVAALFYTATGVSSYAPVIAAGAEPVATNVYTGQTVSLSVAAGGSAPLSYQWVAAPTGSGGPYVPVVNGLGANGETISGAQSATLTIQNVAPADALDYEVLVTNAVPGIVASTVATLTVTATYPAQNITMSVQEAAGADWDVSASWSDGNPASVSAVSEPGSTYELQAGGRLRTPLNALEAAFPGVQLSIDGTGVFVNNPGTGTPQSEVRSKQGVAPNGIATVYFPLLVMDGGQFDNGNPGVIDILGQIDVVSNAIFYVDNGGGAGRPIEIDGCLSGTNNIEYHDFDASLTGGLLITCTTNTFSGTWNDVQGPLVAAGTNCLGTNSITVGATGAFETLYDVHSPAANLTINGVMYLHQNDTFHSVILGNNALSAGTYTAAQLGLAYPKYFPTNWVARFGSTQTTASGSLTILASLGATVLQNPAPAAVSLYPSQTAVFSALGGGNPPLYYQWQLNGTNLTDNGIYTGSLSNVLVVANLTNDQAGNYTIVVSNSLGSITSAPAILTVLPTFPAIQPVTLFVQQPQNTDWNTVGYWNDGQGALPAATIALEFPGSTFEVLPGATLRSPTNNVPFVSFPNASLQIDGSGLYINSPAAGSVQGELRMKEVQYGEVVYFPLLIMNGGQLDNGNPTPVLLQGAMEILTNTPIYVDSSGTEGRTYEIDAYLTGPGSIEYHDFDASMVGGLDITCATNTFTGAWNVVQGPLVGSGANSLGTNSITVGAKAALETLYNVNSPAATLALSGVMYLHENDTFYQMSINGSGIPAGTYTFSQLAAAYPANFPATWTPVYGSTNYQASGSITVLNTLIVPPSIASQPPVLAAEFVAAPMRYSLTTMGSQSSYQWYLNGTAIPGATGSNYFFSSLAGTNTYFCTASNSAGLATSSIATNIAMDPPAMVTFDDYTNWTEQGTAITPNLSSDYLLLTDNGGSEAASAFYNTAQYIEGFSASFTYTPGGSLAADGVTFCVQNAPAGPAALGGTGGNLGYFGIGHSTAFELNIYALATGGVGIGFGTNGSIANPYLGVAPVNLASGDNINVNLYYMQGNLQVKLTDTGTSASFVTNLTVGDYGVEVGDSVGYVGFTGSDGGSVANQYVSNFVFQQAAAPALSIASSGASSGAGTCTLSWSGGSLTSLVLQQSSDLAGPWSSVATPPTLVGNFYQVPVASTGSTQFFRLVAQ